MTNSLKLLPVAALLLGLSGCGLFGGGGDEETTPTIGNRVAVLPAESGIEADPAIADVAITLPAAARNSDWTQPGGDADKTMGHLELSAQPARAWSVQIGEGSSKRGYLGAAPVVEGNRVFVMDARSVVSAYDTQTGRQLWQASLVREGEGERSAAGGGVSVFGGRVYATSGYGLVAAYDATTGNQFWQADAEVPLRGAPTVAEGRVIVMTQDNQAFAYSEQTGERDWEIVGTVEPTGLLGASAPAVALDTVVVGFSSGELQAVRIENARIVWQDTIARTGRTSSLTALSDIDASPVIDPAQSRVYAMGHGGRIVSLDFTTGQRVWEQSVGGTSLPWLAGNWLFAVSTNAELVALQAIDGRVRWISQLQHYRKPEKKKDLITYRGPVLAGGRLWLTSSQGQLLAVDPATGEVVWSAEAAKQFYQPPVVAGGTLYLLDESGRLSAWR